MKRATVETEGERERGIMPKKKPLWLRVYLARRHHKITRDQAGEHAVPGSRLEQNRKAFIYPAEGNVMCLSAALKALERWF